MGIIFAILEWAVALAAAEITLSCTYRAAAARWDFLPRWSPRVPDAGLLLPALCAFACTVLLVMAGALPVLFGLPLAVALLCAAALPLASTMLQAFSVGKAGYAGRRIVSRMLLLVRSAPSFLIEDLRALAGLRRNSAGTAAPAGGTPSGPVITRPRRMPSTARVDPAVGPALVPEQVAAGLEAANVAIPSCYAAVAEWEASFEPEDGEDWRRHIAERAAGILTVAEVVGGQAEDLASGVKLDPAVIASETDFADDYADTASAAIRSIQVYDRVYDGVHEHTDNGGTLPENARGWFGAGGSAPDGQAA